MPSSHFSLGPADPDFLASHLDKLSGWGSDLIRYLGFLSISNALPFKHHLLTPRFYPFSDFCCFSTLVLHDCLRSKPSYKVLMSQLETVLEFHVVTCIKINKKN